MEIHKEIQAIKQELSSKISILGHHYQSDNVMRHVDKAGDSLELARIIENISAEHIIFCGVNFMAESATLLAKKNQYVHIPDTKADCVMAQTTPFALLDSILTKLNAGTRKVIPLAYVNTPLAVKAVVGKHGGAVCTSSNAKKMMQWAFDESKKYCDKPAVLFLPDANLGENTGNLLNINPTLMRRLDIRQQGSLIDAELYKDAQLLFWPSCCAVHARIHLKHVQEARLKYPNCRILVHPECHPQVVNASDGAGSTSFLIKEAQNAQDNSTLVIGTEINLVNRLAKQYAQRVRIVPLLNIACSNMAKITEEALLNKLIEIKEKRAIPFSISEEYKAPALLSLHRMLNIC